MGFVGYDKRGSVHEPIPVSEVRADGHKHADGTSSKPLQMQVDCVHRTRGQFPDPVMRDTFNGTLGREEVKAVCLAAAKEGK
jgi:hypothetical protein